MEASTLTCTVLHPNLLPSPNERRQNTSGKKIPKVYEGREKIGVRGKLVKSGVNMGACAFHTENMGDW